MNEDKDVKEKQEFLRINILEKGYNPDEFMQYLQTLRGEKGLEIKNWSKNDLVAAVREFSRIYPKNQNNIDYGDDDEQDNYGNDYNNNNNNNNNNKNNNNNIVVDNQMKTKEYLNCKRSERNEISNVNNLIITISLPKVVEGSLFTKSYITYLVETKPLGLQVRRRFSDFYWLYDIFKTLYINCIIPPLIKKNYIKGITEVQIQKRMRLIEKFMQEISMHPLLKNSQIFYDFISIRDEKDFNLKKQAYSKLTPPVKAEEIKTLNGEINISINREKELLAEKIKNISEANEEVMKKIIKEYKLLNEQIQGVITKIKDINILWDDLYKKSNKNYDSEMILGVYDSLAKFMEDWGKMQQAQIDLINVKLREYFRFIRNEYHSIKDYYKIYDESKNNYKKSYQKLIETKERLFEEKKIDDWGLDKEDLDNKILLFREKELSMEKMLPDDTKKVKDKKKLYGCYLNSLIEEYEKIGRVNCKRHKDNVIGFIKEISNNIIKFHVSLSEMISYLDTLKEDMFINEN